jgi:hypothetical protein
VSVLGPCSSALAGGRTRRRTEYERSGVDSAAGGSGGAFFGCLKIDREREREKYIIYVYAQIFGHEKWNVEQTYLRVCSARIAQLQHTTKSWRDSKINCI